MSQLGNPAFRRLLSGFGGFGLLFSEMCSARAVPHGPGQPLSAFAWHPEELPHLVCQLFGAEPQDMAAAAARVEREGFFGVDLNFGCAAPGVCRRKCGAALLRDPPLAGKIAAAVRRAVRIPLFVKFRVGWRDDPALAVELARRFEGAGVDGLTFHPRVAPDRRTRRPRWEYIGLVKQAVGIPVFGNGDVFSAADCLRMLEETGCDGVALGRIAVARPWIFAEWVSGRPFGDDIYRETPRRYAELLSREDDRSSALRRFKRFAAYYAANFTFGHRISGLLARQSDLQSAAAAMDRFLAQAPQIATRLNASLLN
jgi:nifR3 family TIM-barrel protein